MLAFRFFGLKGVVVAALALGGIYLFASSDVRQSLFGGATTTTSSAGTVCDASPKNAEACDFSRAVLASTEDVWKQEFAASTLPSYGQAPPSTYVMPTLVVFAGAVSVSADTRSSLIPTEARGSQSRARQLRRARVSARDRSFVRPHT